MIRIFTYAYATNEKYGTSNYDWGYHAMEKRGSINGQDKQLGQNQSSSTFGFDTHIDRRETKETRFLLILYLHLSSYISSLTCIGRCCHIHPFFPRAIYSTNSFVGQTLTIQRLMGLLFKA